MARQSDAKKVAAGQGAWRELVTNHKKSWSLWVQVIAALGVGKMTVIAQIAREKGILAEDVKAQGKKYNMSYSRWLNENKMGDIGKSTRKGCLDCFPHVKEITAALDILASEDPDRMQKMTHPATIWTWFKGTLDEDDGQEKPQRANPLFGKSDEEVATAISENLAARRSHNIARHLLQDLGEGLYITGTGEQIAALIREKMLPADVTGLTKALLGDRDIDAELADATTRVKDSEEFEAVERKKVSELQAQVQELEERIAEGSADADAIEARQEARRLQVQLSTQSQELATTRNRIAELETIIDSARSPDALVKQRIKELEGMVAFQREQSARQDSEYGERLGQLEAERDDLRRQLDIKLAQRPAVESDVHPPQSTHSQP
jgi:hypothetical protein